MAEIMKIFNSLLLLLFISILLFLILNWTLSFRASKNYDEYDKYGKTEDIDGIKVFYREAGEGEPILLIHGFMGCSAYFEDIIMELSVNFKVIAIDLIGFGKSDKRIENNFSKNNMGKIAHELMKKKGLYSYHLFGHSMGGDVALNIVLDNPNSIKSLILVDSGGYAFPRRPAIPPLIIDKFVNSYITQKLFYWFNFYDVRKANDVVFLKLFYYNSLIPGKTLYNLTRQDDRENMECSIPYIDCRTLIIWGRKDRIIRVESAYKFKRDIKNSTLHIIEECGHIPFIEKKQEFMEILISFLS